MHSSLDHPEDTTRDTVLLATNANHGPACGTERTECPACGLPFGPVYPPVERQYRPSGRFLFCHNPSCRGRWREIAA